MPFEFLHSSIGSTCQLEIPSMGLGLNVRLSPRSSHGAVTVLETVNAPGFGPPLHRHRETEVFRILEGEYLYEVDGRRFFATAGDLISVPGGAAHAFVNTSSRPSRQLVLMLPGMDAFRFFTGLSEVMAGGCRDRSELNAFGAPWGVEFLGPPIKTAL